MPSLTERFIDSLISCALHPTDSWPPSKNGDLVAATAEGENKVIYPSDWSSWHKLTLNTQTRLPFVPTCVWNSELGRGGKRGYLRSATQPVCWP